MIDFIKVVDFKINVCKNQEIYVFNEPFTKYFNRLLNQYLVNLSSREKLTKRKYRFENKIPLLLDEDHIFICIRSYRLHNAFYINYFQIVDWKKRGKGVVISFNNNYCIYLDSYNSFIKQIKKVQQML